MKDLPATLEASHWGHAYTLKDPSGVTWGRLLLGEWLDAEAAQRLSLAIAAGPELLAAAEKVLEGLNARIDAAPSEAKPVFTGIADLSDAINRARGGA